MYIDHLEPVPHHGQRGTLEEIKARHHRFHLQAVFQEHLKLIQALSLKFTQEQREIIGVAGLLPLRKVFLIAVRGAF